jgi:PAS domain S-box-containing protein
MTRISDAAERRQGERRSRGRRLTDRQATILDLVASGLENKEIAHQLGISEQAVKEHVSNLLRVLAAPNRAALGDAAATRRFVGTSEIDPDWLRFLFQDAPMHVAVVAGTEHRFVAVNDAYRRSTGRDDLVGKPYREAFPDRAESLAYLDRARATGERIMANALERRFIRIGGTLPEDGYITFALQPLPGPDGDVAGVAIYSIDVTDQVHAREAIRQLESEQLELLESLSVAVIVSDEQGVLLKANRIARELLSLPAPTTRLTPGVAAAYRLRGAEDGREIAFDEIPTVRALRGERVEPRLYRVVDPVGGHERAVRMSAAPLLRADGTVRGTVTTISEA